MGDMIWNITGGLCEDCEDLDFEVFINDCDDEEREKQ